MKMKNKLIISVDVEKDLNTNSYLGITQGLKRFETICDKHKIKPILFTTVDCIKKHPEIFKKLHKKAWKIDLHGYNHKRFDEMSFKEKEFDIKSSIIELQKYIGVKPKAFRAPQHSIDDETLDILEKYEFKYDSSYTPLNLMQLFFFPSKFSLWFKQFFSKTNPYNIRKNLIEIPVSSLLIPPVSLTIRVLPKPILRIYFGILTRVYKQPIFYAHSWDFIELKQSKIDKMFSYKRFLDKLDYIISIYG